MTHMETLNSLDMQLTNDSVKIIDCHKHWTPEMANAEEIVDKTIFSVRPSEFNPVPGVKYSIGIHPWYLDNVDEELELLKKHIDHPQVVAIGEIGLDKLKKDVPFSLQREVLDTQLRLANEHRKPVVLHVVRAIPYVVNIREEYPAIPSVVFHAYQGRIKQATELTELGFFLSFGEKYSRSALQLIPVDKILVESDATTINFDEHIEEIASLRGLKPYEMKQQIKQNIHSAFFGSKFVNTNY